MKQAVESDAKIASNSPQMNPISFMKVIWSSAKFLQHMLESQLSHTKLNQQQLKLSF